MTADWHRQPLRLTIGRVDLHVGEHLVADGMIRVATSMRTLPVASRVRAHAGRMSRGHRRAWSGNARKVMRTGLPRHAPGRCPARPRRRSPRCWMRSRKTVELLACPRTIWPLTALFSMTTPVTGDGQSMLINGVGAGADLVEHALWQPEVAELLQRPAGSPRCPGAGSGLIAGCGGRSGRSPTCGL